MGVGVYMARRWLERETTCKRKHWEEVEFFRFLTVFWGERSRWQQSVSDSGSKFLFVLCVTRTEKYRERRKRARVPVHSLWKGNDWKGERERGREGVVYQWEQTRGSSIPLIWSRRLDSSLHSLHRVRWSPNLCSACKKPWLSLWRCACLIFLSPSWMIW